MLTVADTLQAPEVHGHWDSTFAEAVDAFRANFVEDGEWGAALCVSVGGRRILDLWGGYRDAECHRPWREDTLVNAYSVGKGMLAMLALECVERGELALDAPVARHWPAFETVGKERTTLRQLLSHQAGLPAVRPLLPAAAKYDWSLMCETLAAEAPFWEPGTAHGYHTNTLGFLVGEVMRRATGRGPGALLRERLAAPIGADYHWGLPAADDERVAEVLTPEVAAEREPPEEPDGVIGHAGMVWRGYFNPPGISGFGSVNTLEWRRAVIPSTNGHGTARAVAAIYDHFLRGRRRGTRWVSQALIEEAATAQVDGPDVVLERPSRFGLGFQLPQPERPLGPNAEAFGHFGYGGSLGMADPVTGLAFGYVTNRPGARFLASRTARLLAAIYPRL